jgi:hypothetical protein
VVVTQGRARGRAASGGPYAEAFASPQYTCQCAPITRSDAGSSFRREPAHPSCQPAVVPAQPISRWTADQWICTD